MSRLDRHLAETGLARSRTHAAELIREGRVLLNGTACTKPSRPVGPADAVSLDHTVGSEYVSRAGRKLAGALACFPDVAVRAKRCLDAGASTGGFTQVLLEAGAAQVVAVDVGHGQLAAQIRADPRVSVYEGMNVRHLIPEAVGGPVQLVVGDLSFISLTLVMGPLAAVVVPGGELILMVKPQFEVGRAQLGRDGVVTDPDARRRAVETVKESARNQGLEILGEAPSSLAGQEGNVEHFLHLQRPHR